MLRLTTVEAGVNMTDPFHGTPPTRNPGHLDVDLTHPFTV